MSTATTTPDSERRKVVIALDSSKESKNALAWALDNLVQVDKDHLILLTVGVFADKWSDIVSAALGELMFFWFGLVSSCFFLILDCPFNFLISSMNTSELTHNTHQ